MGQSELRMCLVLVGTESLEEMEAHCLWAQR